MITIRLDRDTRVRHEAAHAAALHALGVTVTHVDVLETPSRGGFCAHNLKVGGPATARHQALHTLCAFLAESSTAVPPWPLNQGPITSSDEEQLAHIAAELGWSQTDYKNLVGEACDLMVTPTFRKAYSGLLDAFEHADQVDGHMLQCALGAPRERKQMATRWMLPENAYDAYGQQVLRDRNAAIRRARTAQAAARRNSPTYKSAHAQTLALEDHLRAQRLRQRQAHELYMLTRPCLA